MVCLNEQSYEKLLNTNYPQAQPRTLTITLIRITLITKTSLLLIMLHHTRISHPQEYVIKIGINVYAQIVYLQASVIYFETRPVFLRDVSARQKAYF